MEKLAVVEALYKYNMKDRPLSTLPSTPSTKADHYQQMAEDCENQPITSEYLQNLMLEEINDPMVARVEEKWKLGFKLNFKLGQVAAATQEGTLIGTMKSAMQN